MIDAFAFLIKIQNGRRSAMIYVTGDMHGDLSRFNDRKITKIKKRDTLIICGDFGFLWSGEKKEKKILKKLGKKRYNIMFVEGCHENYDLLYKYPIEEYKNGLVRRISGNLMQMIRGSIFEIDGVSIFAFGGGQQPEIAIRKENNTHWKQELPTLEEIETGLKNLAEKNQKVDYIVTHEPPSKLNELLDFSNTFKYVEVNVLNATFNEIAEKCEFKKWYFGKCHKNRIISKHYHALFTDTVKIPTPFVEKKK